MSDVKNIRISIFLFPWELDSFQDAVDRLKLAATYLYDIKDFNVIVDVTMNISDKVIDWDESKVEKEFFINSFNNICKKLDYFITTEYNIDETTEIMGCVDKRRESIQKSNDNDFIIWLDTDIFFPTNILYYMILCLREIKNDYVVLSPQLVKLWDTSWDIMTNDLFLADDIEKRRAPGNEPFRLDRINRQWETNGEIGLKKMPKDYYKFSGGWFNLFSAKLLKLIGIPETFGSYGLEDTFVMHIMHMKNWPKEIDFNPQQYLLENVVVNQHQLTSHGFNFEFKKLFKIILPSKDEQKSIAKKHYDNELKLTVEKMIQKLKN
tara:strand:- start:3648 stop:4613 length:966 start_codon:yes stop_codon:yes gene_type:complete